MPLLAFLAQSHPITGIPLRIRPVILALLAAWSTLLLVLGMAPIGEIPINDKVLHFIGMGVFTALTYFIIDVPDASRRIWIYRRAPLILTLFLAFLCADILSEIIQGLLPWKTFQYGDIIANILGSCTAYALSHTLLTRHRAASSIARLYLPISQSRGTDDQQRSRRGRSESVDSVGTWDTPIGYGYGYPGGHRQRSGEDLLTTTTTAAGPNQAADDVRIGGADDKADTVPERGNQVFEIGEEEEGDARR